MLFGFYGYPLQMYADFSGLTDIAVGAGVLFGISAPESLMRLSWRQVPASIGGGGI